MRALGAFRAGDGGGETAGTSVWSAALPGTATARLPNGTFLLPFYPVWALLESLQRKYFAFTAGCEVEAVDGEVEHPEGMPLARRRLVSFFFLFFSVIICETPSEGGRAQGNAGQSLGDVAGGEQRAAMCFGERERCGSRLPKSKGRGRCRSAACGDAEWLGTTLAGMGMALASPRFEVEVGPILLPLCGFWVISPLGAMAQEAACGRRFPSLASLFPILHLPLLPDAVPRG